MSDWAPPIELDQALPRKVRPNALFRLSFWGGVVVLSIITLLITSTIIYNNELKNGVSAVARILKLNEYGQRPTQFRVQYEFTPETESEHQIGTTFTDVSTYVRLREGETVPIVYLPWPPYKSELNLDNVVFTRSLLPVGLMDSLKIFIAGCIGLSLSTSAFLTYRLEKYLLRWGKPAEATITDDEPEAVGRGVVMSSLTYKFVDDAGTAVEGVRRWAPPQGLARRAPQFRGMFSFPTILFDPKDSSRNMFYPGRYAYCIINRSNS